MKLHLIWHDPLDFSPNNISIWAEKRGFEIDQTYACNMEELPSLDDFDWLMVMGGSQHIWEEEKTPWLALEKKFVANAIAHNKIIIGICLGAQLIAQALGGKVFTNKLTEIGWYDVSITPEGRQSFLFRDIPDKFMSFHWHSDHFSLPSGCTRLALTEATENQAFICDGSPVVGLQFHPEYTLDLIRYLTQKEGHEWVKGPFVAGKKAVLSQTEMVCETNWLMEALLDNMVQEFGKC
jgi:GMP synthase (glutamine-hydrolysing)